MDRTDADLIEHAKKDPDAFRELYERHAHSVFRRLRGATNDERVALELTAETFAQAACSLGRFRDLSEGSAGPWLHGIARNLLRRYHAVTRVETAARRRLGMRLESWEGGFERVEERQRSEHLAPTLREVVNGLPEGQRAALELRVIDEHTYDEVAARLGCTEGAARVRVLRALTTLRRRFVQDQERLERDMKGASK
jgi:RNA polymerase sigma factor (sigma-70 family)